MARTRIRPDTQVASPETYDDTLPVGPTLQTAAATLTDDLNALRSQIRRVAGTVNWYDEPMAGGSGWLYIAGISVPAGTASDLVWEDAPGNTVLQSATVSDAAIVLSVRASYPRVRVGVVETLLTRDVSGGFYSGTVAVTLVGSGDVAVVVLTPDGEDGATDTIALVLDQPPVVTSALFTGAYPGIQTELKAGDTFSVVVQADKDFDQVEVLNHEAGAGQTTGVATGQSATISMTVANRGTSPVARYARVRVRDAVTLAWSATYDTNTAGAADGVHTVVLNNLAPSGAVSSVTYPGGQTALKAVEVATVNHTAANYDSIAYTDPNGTPQISIANASTFEAAKTVTALGLAVYNIATTNFRYTMTRNANGAQTTVNAVVAIAGVAPTITVTTPAARLRSGGNNGTAVQNHTITITSNQQLLNAPTLNADSGGSRGTLTGSWSGGPTVWTRTLQVSETVPDAKGTFSWGGLVATGRAGLVQNTINTGGTYVLGGFVPRTLSFAIFASTTSIGTEVIDFSKLTAGIFTQTTNSALKQNIGTAPPVVDGYTIDALSTNPTSLIWLDTTQVGANGTGLATITNVEETV